MKLLHQILGIDKIYTWLDAGQIAVFYGSMGFVGAVTIYSHDFVHNAYGQFGFSKTLLVIIGIYFFMLIRVVARIVVVRHYLSAYQQVRMKRDENFPEAAAVNLELKGIDKLSKIYSNQTAAAYLATFEVHSDFYVANRTGKLAGYMVVQSKLVRQLPHVLFDSKHAKRRQFSKLYLSTQAISIQPLFDAHFDTYVAEDYHIDALSFITPEIMEQLLSLKDFDLEIVGDYLILYAPIIDRSRLVNITDQVAKLAEQLDGNIDTYRDNRLPAKTRTTQVTPFGQILLKSSFKNDVLAVVITAAAIFFIGSGIADGENRMFILFHPFFLMYDLLALTLISRSIAIRKANKRALNAYRQKYQAK